MLAVINPVPSLWRHPSFTSSALKMSSASGATDDVDDTAIKKQKNRVALLQFRITQDKSQNLKTAQEYIRMAHEAGASLCVLPEIWNGPYATSAFADYAEILPEVGDSLSDDVVSKDEKIMWGPSSTMLMDLAKDTKMYIVGGSIPEIVSLSQSDKLYNTCLIINPKGEVVGKHRKVHLFDVDVPGGIRFCESETLSAGEDATFFDVDEDENTDGGLGRIGVGIWYVQYLTGFCLFSFILF